MHVSVYNVGTYFVGSGKKLKQEEYCVHVSSMDCAATYVSYMFSLMKCKYNIWYTYTVLLWKYNTRPHLTTFLDS